MPQGRRKMPFSAKQKKEQLKQKRERKRNQSEDDSDLVVTNRDQDDESNKADSLGNIVSINEQPKGKITDSNRYALKFFVETKDELKQRREDAMKPIVFLNQTDLEVESEQLFSLGSDLGMPKRPKWDLTMTTTQLEINEQKYFREYLANIERIHSTEKNISYFDLNLETWRQLWRVVEMSEVILLIADIRHPIFHFPPSLYNYVTNEKNKSMILVLNKIDLVPAQVVVAWQHYLNKKYPKLYIVPFASYAGMKQKRGKKRIGKLRMAAKGSRALLNVCEQIVGDQVDLSSWKNKIEDEIKEEEQAIGGDVTDEEDDPLAECEKFIEKLDLTYKHEEKFKNGILTIGFVGHPNVGKSSLLNAIMGKKVVSVSRTPGHTKHFQTIFLTPNVRLCDCPGLVFPSRAPKQLQVLMGCFPIAQLREPYSTISYLAQRMNLIEILHIKKDKFSDFEDESIWSAYEICEQWGVKRGFLTAKTGRPDVYRAANHLLRMALDGRTICLYFYPKGYFSQKDFWKNHNDVKFIQSIQGGKIDFHDFEIEKDKSDEDEDQDSESDNDDNDGSFQVSQSKFSALQDLD